MRNQVRVFGVTVLFVLFVVSGCGSESTPPLDDVVSDVGADVADVIVPPDSDDQDVSVRDLQNDQGGEDVTEGEDTALPPVCPSGTVCDDNNSCTVDDICQEDGETCAGTVVAGCNDSLDCTWDACATADECVHELKPGWCLVEGACIADGEFSSDNPCMACITALASDKLFPDDAGTCDDLNACTVEDRCSAGACVGSAKNCDDSNPCTADSCLEGNCVNDPTDGVECEDGSSCTVDDVCVQDSCVGQSVECDDADVCTSETCHPDFGCMYEFNSEDCQDGNACTTGDVCFAGECSSGLEPLVCDDENICTDDGCVPSKGCVVIPNTAPCSDNDPCTLNDSCAKSFCVAGIEQLNCDDTNICTNDSCVPGDGCLNENNTEPCDDNNECTVGDTCGNGGCVPGVGEVDCEDNNVCTDDACVQGEGCVNVPNADECEDNDVCTGMGTCSDAKCVRGPVVVDCNDELECTADSCHPVDGCRHAIVNSAACRPQITIDFPERAATLDGVRDITILGHVDLGLDASLVPFVTLNGTMVAVMPDGTFQLPATSDQGFNGIVVEAEDLNGLKDRVVQSYYYSTEWFPFSETDPTLSNINDGLMLFLGPEVWDDNDTSTMDDIASIIGMYVSTLDLMTMITNPISTGDDGVLCGTHTININSISYGTVAVDLVPVNGGLYLSVVIPNLRAALSGKYCRVNFSGFVTANSITVTSTLLISIDPVTGKPVITMTGTNSVVSGLSVDINNFPGFLEDLLMTFFGGTFSGMIEDAIKDQISALIPSIQDMLEGLAINETFEIPALFEGATPMSIALVSGLSSIQFTTAGGLIGLKASFTAPRGTTHEKLGSIGRANCLRPGIEPNPAFPAGSMAPQLELGLKDDLLNELVYALYWGGALTMPIPPSVFGDSLGDYGVTDMNMTVDFLLPPILSACNSASQLKLAVGDVQVNATLKLFGSPLDMVIYASLKAGANILATAAPDGSTQLGVAINYPDFIDMEIASLTGNLAGAEDIIKDLVMDTLLPSLLGTLDGTTPLFEFAIPSIDISSFIEGVPPGTALRINVNEVLRAAAFTVASGTIQ
jgi:hypothetical protein